MAEAIRIHREVTGERPIGWYTGRCSTSASPVIQRGHAFAGMTVEFLEESPRLKIILDRENVLFYMRSRWFWKGKEER
jgi:hypothetical protein